MQNNYLNSGKLNSAMVSCISALGATRRIDPVMRTPCFGLFKDIAPYALRREEAADKAVSKADEAASKANRAGRR